MSPLEITTVVLSVIYVILAGLEKPLCWPIGVLASVIAMLYSYELKYYQDAILQVYYILVGFYGWYIWLKKDKTQHTELHISTKTFKQLLPWFIGGAFAVPALGYLFAKLGNTYSYIDAFTTVFSFIATWLTARKVLQNWVMWVVVDAVLAYQFGIKQAYLLSGLYVFYSVISVWGYYNWQKKFAAQQKPEIPAWAE